MKTSLLINTVSHPLLTAKLSPKNASSFAMGKPLTLRIIVGPETAGMQICQNCGGTVLQ